MDEIVVGGGGESEEELVAGGWEFGEGIAGLVWASNYADVTGNSSMGEID